MLRFTQLAVVRVLGAVALCSAALGNPALAQNAEFQDFFFRVCDSASGALAARCNETNDGEGNLSGDSESSLNPSQALSGADSAFFAAQQRLQEMSDTLTDKRSDTPTNAIEIGPWSLLFNGHLVSVDTDRDPGRDAERGFQLDEVGVDVGVDYRFSDQLIVGAMLHFTDGDLQFDREDAGRNFTPSGAAGDVDSSSWGTTVFFSKLLGETGYIDGSLGYSRMSMDVSRSAVFQESNRVIQQVNSQTAAATDSDQTHAMLRAGFTRSMGGWSVTPSLGISHIATSVDDYTEQDLSGSGLAMRFSTADRDGSFGHAGVIVTRAFSMTGWVLLPQLSAEYVEEFSDDTAAASAAFVNDGDGNVFALNGLDEDRSRFDWSVGFTGVMPNGITTFIEYQQSSGMGTFERSGVVAGIRVEL